MRPLLLIRLALLPVLGVTASGCTLLVGEARHDATDAAGPGVDHGIPPELTDAGDQDATPPADGSLPDHAPTPDLAGPSCFDGIRNGGETDVDCGGSCGKCPGQPCTSDGQCATLVCDQQGGATYCGLAADPPAWLPGTALPTARAAPALLGKDGQIYVVGGYSGFEIADVDAWNPANMTWNILASLHKPRTGPGVAVDASGRLYAMGGYSKADGTVPSSVERYHNGAWSLAVPSPKVPRIAPGAATSPTDLIYLVGGQDPTNQYFVTDAVEILDPAKATWSPSRPLPFARAYAATVFAPDGRLYVIGGVGSSGVIASIDAYSPAMDAWFSGSHLATPRTGAGAVAAPDGRLYVVGGRDANSAEVATVEAYSLASRECVAVRSLSSPRGGAGVALGPDGRIYAFGGSVGMTQVATVQIYGPAVTLSKATGAVGDAIQVGGQNFAAAAQVFVYFDGKPVGSAKTGAQGAIPGTISFAVPPAPAGVHLIKVMDMRSRYPVSFRFDIE